jgi:cytochrome P450 family 6
MFKDLARKLHVTFTRRETSDFFMNAVKQTVEYRENHNVQRNDFMHLLIQLKNGVNGSKDLLTLEEIAAQGKGQHFWDFVTDIFSNPQPLYFFWVNI